MNANKIKALIFGFIFSVMFSMIGFSEKCESISDKVLRLHIIANSNFSYDQDLKLKVRDEILDKFGSSFDMDGGLLKAEESVNLHIKEIENVARETVLKNGFDYEVKAEIKKMYFEIRQYRETTLPAGFYKALRITIGSGKGKNWWCVMFPPMCLPAAEEKEKLSDVLSQSELDIVENETEYIIKFKLLEFFTKSKDFIESQVFEKTENYIESLFEKINQNYEIGLSFFENT